MKIRARCIGRPLIWFGESKVLTSAYMVELIESSMTGSHTGQNLAQTIANALKKAGIEQWVR